MLLKTAVLCVACAGAPAPVALAHPGLHIPPHRAAPGATNPAGWLWRAGLEVVPSEPPAPLPRAKPRPRVGASAAPAGRKRRPEVSSSREERATDKKAAATDRETEPAAPQEKEAAAQGEALRVPTYTPGANESAPRETGAAQEQLALPPPQGKANAGASAPGPEGEPGAGPAAVAADAAPYGGSLPENGTATEGQRSTAARPSSSRCPSGLVAVRDNGQTITYLGADPAHPNVCLQSNGREIQRLWSGLWAVTDPNSRQIAEALSSVLQNPFGGEARFEISDPRGSWRETLQNESLEYMTIGGRRLLALHLKETRETSGPQKFRLERSFWIDQQTRAVVRQSTREETVDGDAPAEIIPTGGGAGTWTVVALRFADSLRNK